MLNISKSRISDNQRVVVTGLGVVSSLGIGWKPFWKNIIAGKSGISKVEAFDTSQYDRHYAGEVKNFDPTQFMDKKKAAQMGRTSQMAIAACKLALKDAKLTKSNISNNKTGICLGTTMGEGQVIESIVKQSVDAPQEKLKNILALTYPANSISTNVALELGIGGENKVFANACAAGNYAIGQAFDFIKTGRTEFMLAGGVDALSRIAFTGFSRLFAMAPEKCQPFDKNRKGMLLGEGAGVVLLETFSSAKKRKAHIYAEVLGYGLSCDAHHMTASDSDGISKAVRRALESSKVKAEEIDYVSAHGTGTKENDSAECRVFQDVFKKRVKNIPISSIKSMLGHTMGAAAAIEAIACCLAIQDSRVPPTINFDEKDSECDIDCVSNKSRKQKLKTVLNNSQAFGGNNACLVLSGVK